MEKLEKLINYIIKELVDTKDAVMIDYDAIDDTITFKVSVAKGMINPLATTKALMTDYFLKQLEELCKLLELKIN